MSDPRVQVDGFFGISASDSARWSRLYDRGAAVARLKGFCVHTPGCDFRAQDYHDRIFAAPARCTCGLHDALKAALAEADEHKPARSETKGGSL